MTEKSFTITLDASTSDKVIGLPIVSDAIRPEYPPSVDVPLPLRVCVPDLTIPVHTANIVPVKDEVVSQKGQANGLVLKSGDVPRVVHPIADVVRVLDESVKVDGAVIQCEVEDPVEVATKINSSRRGRLTISDRPV